MAGSRPVLAIDIGGTKLAAGVAEPAAAEHLGADTHPA